MVGAPAKAVALHAAGLTQYQGLRRVARVQKRDLAWIDIAGDCGFDALRLAVKRIAWQADATGEQQLAGFIKKFDSKNATLIR